MDGTYGFFALMMLAALLCVLAGALNHQWLAGAASTLLLLTLAVYAVLALAGVAVLSVGSDGWVLGWLSCHSAAMSSFRGYMLRWRSC